MAESLLTMMDNIDADLDGIARQFPPDTSSPVNVRQRLTAYREVIDGYRRRLEQAHRAGAGGRSLCETISTMTDRIVLHAFGRIFHEQNDMQGVAFVCLGGYGRRELNPHSDVDLLCLTGDNVRGRHDPGIATVLQFLWDLNLDLGHSTRSACQCLDAVRDDTDFATSLLEARFLAGDRGLFDDLAGRYRASLHAGDGHRLAALKTDELRRRHKLFGGTVQVQEPNVKESPGGLRDIHTVRWLLAFTRRDGERDGWLPGDLLAVNETAALAEDFDFLLRVRSSLHFLSRKKTDILDHMILPDVASHLGCHPSGTQAIETLMHDYYMRTARVRRLTSRAVDRIMRDMNSVADEHVACIPGLVIGERRVRFEGDPPGVLANDPRMAVTLFAVAGANNLDVSPDSASAVERFIGTWGEDLSDNPGVRDAFRKLFNIPLGVGRALRLMHEHGLLVRLVPEFGEISWHYQYDYYHTFTTDEHSIRVVENLERMVTRASSFDHVSDIAPEVTARAALYLAGILHDVGKKWGREHAGRGETMAARALRRLGYDRRTVELVRFLIREHLLMSHISQRRDMDDEDTIADFIGRVGSEGRLRMLMLLTVADLMALSPGALTEWKKALLRSLYDRALAFIGKGYEQRFSASRTAMIDTTVRALSGEYTEATVRSHLDLLPGHYLRVTRRRSIARHISGIERLETATVWSAFEHRHDVSLLTVITRDYQRALSDICGTITSSGINIVGARIFTRNDGIIIDTFIVVNADGGALIPSEIQREFKRAIARVICGETAVADLIQQHRNRWKRRRAKAVPAPTRIRIDNELSSRYTVVDVFATDYSGLLYDITSVLASLSIDIHTARIGTDEDQVADAFYLQHRGGGKIEDARTLSALKTRLLARLKHAAQ